MRQDNSSILHFSLGPVQGFIGQARRTRDLWAGSFLLSWLTGHAMKAVLDAGGEIVFPSVGNKQKPSDPLLAAILGMPLHSDPNPRIGSLPNRFKAKVSNTFDPKIVAQAVREFWQRAADTVWKEYVQPLSPQGRDTEEIWLRQVTGFWEINWVIGPDPGDGTDNAWLDARKNWRVPASREPEGGDHCTVMHDLQELSGYIRSRERDQQQKFWEALREQTGSRLDLRPDERLSAIALIKRLYPKVSEQATGWRLDVSNWPSTAYMAAVHWIAAAWETDSEQCRKYAESVRQSFEQGADGERKTELGCLKNVDGCFKWLDGNAFHMAALENQNVTFLKQEERRLELVEALRERQHQTKMKTNIGATSFYALLLMDGDSLGKLLREHSDTEISRALATFTRQAPEVVREHNGVAVYAGGDDVLALLPLEDAMPAAIKLNEVYRQAFKSSNIDDTGDNNISPTISSAIVYVHYRWPLRGVLAEAHHLLDAVAKDGNGRDSLAVSVLQGSGKNVEWVVSWDSKATENLRELAEAHRNEAQFSTRLLYWVDALFRMWVESSEKNEQFMSIDFSREELLKLLMAQAKRNRENESVDSVQTGVEQLKDDCQSKDMAKLLEICLGHPNKESGGPRDGLFLQPSGAKLLHFIARRGEAS